MSFTYYFYTAHRLEELKQIVSTIQEDFEALIKDHEDDLYVREHERELAALANPIAQPILIDMSFDDFYVKEGEFELMRGLFDQSKSCLCLEEIPYLASNPFQVTWLQMLLPKLGAGLVDTGGVNVVKTLQNFEVEVKRYKSLLHMLGVKTEAIVVKSTPFRPVEPLDFTLRDVYLEFERIKRSNGFARVEEALETSSEKMKKLYSVTKDAQDSTSIILRKSGLHPKDFGDFLESLKFFLKRF